MSNLTPITDEQRQKAKENRQIAQEYARNHLKIEYSEEKYWAELASNYGLRMPNWWVPATEVKYIRRACKKLGVDINAFLETTGFSNVNQLVEANKNWNAVGMVGLVLEFKQQMENI